MFVAKGGGGAGPPPQRCFIYAADLSGLIGGQRKASGGLGRALLALQAMQPPVRPGRPKQNIQSRTDLLD